MNKIPKAVSCLDRALSLNPNLERAWSHKGIALSKLGNYEEALKCYDQAIKINPIISDTWYNKGLNYYNSGNTEDALSCFNKAIEIEPSLINAHYQIGFIFQKMNRFKEALIEFNKVLELNPKDINALLGKGWILGNKGEYEKALETFNELLSLDPKHSRAWLQKGIALGLSKRTEEALEAFSKSIDINPEDSEVWFNKGMALEKLDKYTEALDCYSKSINKNENDYRPWHNKGYLLAKLGEHEKALSNYQRALEINPNHSEGWHNFGNSYQKLEKYNEALKCYNESLKINTGNDVLLSNKGLALKNLNRYDEALESFNKALKINNKNPYTLYNLGFTLEQKGNYTEAIKYINKSLKINPFFPEALNIKGTIYSDLEDYDKALDCYNKATILTPNDPGLISNKGNIFAKLGNYSEAIKYFKQTLEINPKFATGYFNLGATYIQMRKYKKASQQFIKAKGIFKIEGNEEAFKKTEKYENWSNNTLFILTKLEPLDDSFINSLKSTNLFDLRKQSEVISDGMKFLETNFKDLIIPDETKELLIAKTICFGLLKQILIFKPLDIKDFQYVKGIFNKWNLDPFNIALDSIELFFQKIKKYNSIEEISEEDENELLKSLTNIQIFDGNLTLEIADKVQGDFSTTRPKIIRKEVLIDFVTLSGLKKKEFIRICLVPLEFELTETFPYKLKHKEIVYNKIKTALDLAKKNDVEIICFPELSFEEDFIELIKVFENMIIICGSYYDENYYNKCVVLYNGNIYPIYKINPAPYLEDQINPDKCMKCGNEIKVFLDEKRNIRFTILICIDFYRERLKPFDCEVDGQIGVNLIFVPSYKDNKKRFQKTCDSFCENYSADVIKVSDSNLESITCVFGRSHRNLIERLKAEGYRDEDAFENKLCEAYGEMMLIIDLSSKPLEIPTPVNSASRIIIVKRYIYKDENWSRV